jgi:FlaG protein
MESVQTITTSVGMPQPVVARPASPPVVEAIPTDLSPAKSVTAANTAIATSNNGRNNPTNYQNMVVIDPATREVVFRVVDSRSGQVVRQIPDQALLRMQAYTRALDEGKTPTEAMALTDFQA